MAVINTCEELNKTNVTSERNKIILTYRSFVTTVSQLKICDFSGDNFKGFEVLQFSTSATTTQLFSSGEFCNLRYDTIRIKSASANVFFLYQ